MERRALLSISGLVCGTAYLVSTYDNSPVYSRPTQSFVVILIALGLLSFVAERRGLLNSTIAQGTAPNGTFVTLPGSERTTSLHTRQLSTGPAVTRYMRTWPPWTTSALLVSCLCIRVPVTLGVISRIECSQYTIECFMPFLLGVLELYASKNAQQSVEKSDSPRPDWSSVKIGTGWRNSRYRSLLATLALAISGTAVLSRASANPSTYICRPNGNGPTLVLLFQVFGLLIDTLIVLCASCMLQTDTLGRHGADGIRRFARSSFASSAILAFLGCAIYVFHPELHSSVSISSPTYFSAVFKVLGAAALVLYCARQVSAFLNFQQIVLVVTLCATFLSDWLTAWAIPLAIRPPSETTTLFGLAIMLLTFTYASESHLPPTIVEKQSVTASRVGVRIRSLVLSAAGFTFILRFYLSSWSHMPLPIHPIDLLIHEAAHREALWGKKNVWTGTLGMAVVNYRDRYGRSPPPNFDKWYTFAVDRNSSIIDDFDNIHHDMLPYWAVSPSTLRQSTVEDIVTNDNSVGGVRIRNQEAEVAPGVPESHRWMLEEFVGMLLPFIEHLPDMDIAINLNDESRVMLDYAEKRDMMRRAKAAFAAPIPHELRKSFDYHRVTRWPVIGSEGTGLSSSVVSGPMFHSYGSTHCNPSSAARNLVPWQLQHVCLSCQAGHSHPLGPFPPDVSRARDVCHQPDLSYLHGFYSSPSHFEPVKELRATFSHLQAPGFMDIRYPSPWNYGNRTVYAPDSSHPDPDFKAKTNSLFWRGATTEGLAADDGRHAWRGMTRQRFVNFANNPSPGNVLLPSVSPARFNNSLPPIPWRYERLSALEINKAFSVDAAILQPIADCIGRDCEEQIGLFNRTYSNLNAVLHGLAPTPRTSLTTGSIDFQKYWRYRYLFDMDGSGFNGRFIPFLKSNSLPFRTTGVFSEWWEGRVIEWWHYVPVDNRLNGLWSTMAYFMGVKLDGDGHKVDWLGRQDQAAQMAARGRERANQVLRKEDMEIYLFRLLLEWGRLIDEGRDEIGYRL